MTRSLFTKVEFLGGPEDGQELGPELIAVLQELADPGGCQPIPVVRVDPHDITGMTLEGELIGCYVAKQIENGTLLYVWAPASTLSG